MSLSEHAKRNRAAWDEWAPDWVEPGRRNWSQEEPSWGIWKVPEAELGVVPDVAGLDVLEAGCGTAYWSAWFSRRGARVTGIDNSERQLETARQLQQEFGLDFPLVHGSAEELPFEDDSFDLVFSEYGACLWADPYLWIPEATRVLRPGGELLFMTNGTILMLCSGDDENEPAAEQLMRPYFGMHRFEWPDDDSVEFHLGYGEWIALLREHGFEIEQLVHVRAPADAQPNRFGYVTPEWAQRWPAEEIWKARKRG